MYIYIYIYVYIHFRRGRDFALPLFCTGGTSLPRVVFSACTLEHRRRISCTNGTISETESTEFDIIGTLREKLGTVALTSEQS